MDMTLLVHIVAGGLGLVSGFVALYAAKGATLHRKSGMVFVYTMLTMCTAGIVVAAGRGAAPALNIPAALLTAYLVITALITVRPPLPGGRWLDLAAMLVALAVGLTCLFFGFEAIAGGGKRNGMPAFPFFLFGVVAVLASASDLRMMRSGRLQGAPRLARHLWRMCFALWIAAMSFFLGQADVFPEPLRIRPLLALPVVTVLVTMLYWLWRVRTGRAGILRHATLRIDSDILEWFRAQGAEYQSQMNAILRAYKEAHEKA
jgi:BrnA antitoxin of type II toxin-antitoxin system